jgi:hypothetical protein
MRGFPTSQVVGEMLNSSDIVKPQTAKEERKVSASANFQPWIILPTITRHRILVIYLFVISFTTLRVADCTASNDRMAVNNELEGCGKKLS